MKSKVPLSITEKIYKALSVSIMTVDGCSLKEKKIGRVDFLKVNTEGHDLEVLKGATTMLNNQQIQLTQIERQETGLGGSWGALELSNEVEMYLNTFTYIKVKSIGHVFAKFYDDFYMPKPD